LFVVVRSLRVVRLFCFIRFVFASHTFRSLLFGSFTVAFGFYVRLLRFVLVVLRLVTSFTVSSRLLRSWFVRYVVVAFMRFVDCVFVARLIVRFVAPPFVGFRCSIC
jgi:hypothetical protein